MASNFTGRNNYSLLSRPPPPVVLNLYQNNLPSRTSSMRHYNKFSNPHGSSSNLPPEVSEANLEDSKLQNELQSSAYTLTPVYIDANLKTMTKGLQLQQSIWLEQPAFKQVYTKIIKLIQLINSLNSKENTAISTTLQLIKTLLVTDIPYCLDQLKEANNTYINTLSSRKKDIEHYKDEDMKFFSAVTTSHPNANLKNVVVMGRKTYESLPEKCRPLPNRTNIVISTTLESKTSSDLMVLKSPADVEEIVKRLPNAGYVFVIVYLTRVNGCIECDTFAPCLTQLEEKYNFVPVAISNTYSTTKYTFDFAEYHQKNSDHPEKLSQFINQITGQPDESNHIKACPSLKLRTHPEIQYLDIIANILNTGAKHSDRTGVGTIANFGYMMHFDLKNSFPLLTTKNVYWKGVAEELLWFIKGDTNAKNLSAKNVKIWEGNGSREYLDSRGLHNNEVGDLGPVYGFQWRHFGAEYTNMHADYKGKGFDQLQKCIDTIKNNPSDRRIIMTAWNVADLDKMALPPCHILSQFYVADGQLSCILYQRSADMGLGVPFNIASYSLLCCLVAQVCNLSPGKFTHVLGNAHVYLNHVDALKEQLKRCPKPFPKLIIDPSIKNIDEFEYKHLKIEGYHPHPKIVMQMAV
ncbi:uncharacterized protein LOC133320715 [Danaus plexippus]|uniref:uncharacterized protein LOC133320715 n=1 Tax=Danaus plexippus TaxID=13037 RepID=UPI002AAF29DD|nr:uncharacterized protein LOC133320715 [Danaus plexippus]